MTATMPVMMIAVASVLLFIAIVALLTVAACAEHRQLRRIRFDPEAQPFTLSLNDAFDPDHALLWSTQMPVLQLIGAAGDRGVTYACLFRLYEISTGKYPELYEGSSFAQWLFFLQRSELVSLRGRRICMTEYGRGFLKYCIPKPAIEPVHAEHS